MSFRFLYLDSDGEEIQLETQADLQRAVESGELAEDMLLYDALTAEWSPARTHPLVRLALDSDDGVGPDRGGGESRERGARKPDTLGPADFSGLTLTPDGASDQVEVEPDPDAVGPREDETVHAFRERLERERLRQAELQPGSVTDGLSMVRGDRIADLEDPTASEGAATTSPPRDAPVAKPTPVEEPRVEPPAPVSGGEPLEPLDVPSGPTGSWARDRRPPPRSEPSPPTITLPWGITPQAAILALLIGVAGWGIADALGSSSDEGARPEQDAEVEPIEPVPQPESDVGSGVDVRASTYAAFSEMQDGMEALGTRLGVAEPPSAWLSGRYLADADTLPEVRDFWIRYAEFVDSIRVSEEELFRSGFITRLRREGVTGSAIPIRLSGAIQDFRADSTRREEIYRSMDILADEALALDDWLREASDRIAFAGVRGGAVSMAPEIEAAPLDEETRRSLDAYLNRVLDALERVTGPDPARARNLTGEVFTDAPEGDTGEAR